MKEWILSTSPAKTKWKAVVFGSCFVCLEKAAIERLWENRCGRVGQVQEPIPMRDFKARACCPSENSSILELCHKMPGSDRTARFRFQFDGPDV